MHLGQSEVPTTSGATATVARARIWPAALTLFVFAALIPESIATVNTPAPTWLLNPVEGLFMMAFYGSANLVIRELRVRRGLGWTSVLLLGVVFGFANEGIIAVTWFRVIPTDGYIYQNGVDWAWAAALTAFHAIFSVAVPIAFVEILFPRIAGRSWLSRRPPISFAILFALVTALGFYPEKYRINQWPVLAAMVALTIVALALPRARGRARSARRAPRALAAATLRRPRGVPLLLRPLRGAEHPGQARRSRRRCAGCRWITSRSSPRIFAVCVVVARRWTGRAGWGPPQALALITGGMVPSLLISLGFVGQLQPLITVPFFLWLVWLAWRVKQSPLRTAAMTPA